MSSIRRLRASVASRLLMAAAMVVLTAGAAAPGDARPAQVSRTAYHTAPLSDALPPVLFEEFPPGLVCLLAPDLCNEQLKPLTGPIDEVVRGIELPAGPVQPVAPGTLPVGLLGGHQRYTSYLAFSLPPVPEGKVIEQLELVLHEDGVTYALESPAFRGALRALIAQESDPSPEHFSKLLEGVAAGETPLAVTEPTGVEVCPVTEPWEAGENQPAAGQPGRDCVFGANGIRGEDGAWTFDLTFAAQSWADGLLPNHGVYLGPVGAENAEYGDPDPSTNFQVSFAGPEADASLRPALRVVYGERMADDTGGSAFSAGPVLDGGGSSGFTTSVDAASSPGFASDAAVIGDEAAPEPSAAGGAAVPAQTGAEPVSAPATGLPWPAWLLLPLGLSGAALFARAAEASPDLEAGRDRPSVLDALTRTKS